MDGLSAEWNVTENILKRSAFQSYVVVLNALMKKHAAIRDRQGN